MPTATCPQCHARHTYTSGIGQPADCQQCGTWFTRPAQDGPATPTDARPPIAHAACPLCHATTRYLGPVAGKLVPCGRNPDCPAWFTMPDPDAKAKAWHAAQIRNMLLATLAVVIALMALAAFWPDPPARYATVPKFVLDKPRTPVGEIVPPPQGR